MGKKLKRAAKSARKSLTGSEKSDEESPLRTEDHTKPEQAEKYRKRFEADARKSDAAKKKRESVIEGLGKVYKKKKTKKKKKPEDEDVF